MHYVPKCDLYEKGEKYIFRIFLCKNINGKNASHKIVNYNNVRNIIIIKKKLRPNLCVMLRPEATFVIITWLKWPFLRS